MHGVKKDLGFRMLLFARHLGVPIKTNENKRIMLIL